MEAPVEVWTIGHSNQDLDDLVALLRKHGIKAVADVRSVPRSGYAPQFDQAVLRRELAEAGIGYVFLGRELGGRPDDDALYDADDHVRYDLLALTPTFRAGLERLTEGARTYRVAMLCSEEDPSGCHRRLLLARVLVEEGARVRHIRADGSVQDDDALGPYGEATVQRGLFGEERSTWRSVRPVSRDGRPRSSSRP